MAASTSYKLGLTQPIYGEYSGLATGWTDAVNANWAAIDASLSLSTTLTSTGSNINIAADPTKYRAFQLAVTSATVDCSVLLPAKRGFWMASNLSAKTITWKVASGLSVVTPTGKSTLIYSDGVNVVEVDTSHLKTTGGTLTGNLTIASGTTTMGMTLGSSGSYIYGSTGGIGITNGSKPVTYADATGDLAISAAASVGGTLYVTGATTLNSTLAVGGNAFLYGYLQFNSGYGSSAIAYGCRAWAAITGSTGAIRGSSTSFACTRTGTGVYVISFPAMPDANYSVSLSTECNAAFPNSIISAHVVAGSRSAAGFQVITLGATNIATDPGSLFVTIHR